ncbi:AEC family transporter [Rosenbergiella collisarenosi]|uniref:AEC family transporter n=1 Tax=Rosenbergiella collisarenosi TaxID=1544695 RepID=UPI001BDAB8D7|nr:AEC family transporter [Rosenbergiella collisarenosi]MBT0720876.1 AEC family transporter [Rosenbergiella collisarenosi]
MNPLLIICLLLGIAARRFLTFPEQLVPSINWWLITIALPALIITLIPHTPITQQSLVPIAGMWCVFLGALGLALLLGKLFSWSKEVVGVVALVAGIGNTSFMGYPIVQSYYGAAGLQIAVIADQVGSFIILSTVGVMVMALCAGKTPTVKMIAQRVITFPPFIALCVSLLIRPFHGLPSFLEVPLAQIGATLTPLALFCVGLQIALRPPRGALSPLISGIVWKLIAAPLVVWGVVWVTHSAPLTQQVTVIEAAMAPMIAAAIMAQRAGLQPALANALQGYAILLSFLTLPVWHLLLSR